MCMIPFSEPWVVFYEDFVALIVNQFFLTSIYISQVSPLSDIDKLLDCEMRPTLAEDSDATKLGSKQIFVKQYLVKWKGLSYLHCTW